MRASYYASKIRPNLFERLLGLVSANQSGSVARDIRMIAGRKPLLPANQAYTFTAAATTETISPTPVLMQGYGLRRRQESTSEEAKDAWKAQHRLHKRYMKLGAAGKDQRKVVIAVARERLGLIWAIGTRAETIVRQQAAA
jgi:hypothetical protein